MNNKEIYKKIFIEVFKVEEEELNENFAYSLVEGWDSVAHMVLMTSLEDEFDIMLDTEEILNFSSFAEGKNVLRKYDIVIDE